MSASWSDDTAPDALVKHGAPTGRSGRPTSRLAGDRVAPAGVFVVDAKAHEGLIEVRNRAWFFRPDSRLTVGRRDKSKLARKMRWQVEAVRAALEAAGIEPLPPITAVLCFVDGRWPLFRPPNEFEGVRLESERSIRGLFTASEHLDSAGIDRLSRALAIALPPR